MMKPYRIQAISPTLVAMRSLPVRTKVIPICMTALLMVLMGLRLEAQPRSAEFRFHLGTGAFYDSSEQLSAGSSYRHYFGERGWAIEPEYSLMTEKGHQDHMLVLNAVKDLTLPSKEGGALYDHGSGSLFSPSRHSIRTFFHGNDLGMGDGAQGVGWGSIFHCSPVPYWGAIEGVH